MTIMIKVIIQTIKDGWRGFKMTYLSSRRDRYGYIDPTSTVRTPTFGPRNRVFIYDHVNVEPFSKFLCNGGNFIIKKYSGIAAGLTVITHNHQYKAVGQYPHSKDWSKVDKQDVIVGEHCWIGANVTLCPGAVIGRGSIVAAGSVVTRGITPPLCDNWW